MAREIMKLEPTTYIPSAGRRSQPITRPSAPALERESVRTEITVLLDALRLRRSA